MLFFFIWRTTTESKSLNIACEDIPTPPLQSKARLLFQWHWTSCQERKHSLAALSNACPSSCTRADPVLAPDGLSSTNASGYQILLTLHVHPPSEKRHGCTVSPYFKSRQAQRSKNSWSWGSEVCLLPGRSDLFRWLCVGLLDIEEHLTCFP